MPHIEERRKKRDKEEGEEKGKKKTAKEKVSGWKEVRRKAKERRRHIARQWKSVPRRRGSYLYHPRGACKKKKKSAKTREEGTHIFAVDHNPFNVKFEHVMRRQLLLAVFTGELRKATRKFQRIEEIGFSLVRARNPTKCQLFLHRREKDRVYIIPRRAWNTFAEYIVEYTS